MASSTSRLNGSDLLKHGKRSFKTVLERHQVKIPLPPTFCKHWSKILKKEGHCWVEYGDCHFMLSYNESQSHNYLTPGNKLAQVLMLTEPTTIKLKYHFSDNTFSIKNLGPVKAKKLYRGRELVVLDESDDDASPSTVKPASIGTVGISAQQKPNRKAGNELEKAYSMRKKAKRTKTQGNLTTTPATASSKPEITKIHVKGKVTGGGSTSTIKRVPMKAEVTPAQVKRGQHQAGNYFLGNLDGNNAWKTTVTAAAASTHHTQVMHFPKKVTRAGLLKNQTTILIKTNRNEGWTRCEIKTAKKDKFDKFISKDWGKILKNNGIKEGDVLVFRLLDPTTKMFLQIFRA